MHAHAERFAKITPGNCQLYTENYLTIKCNNARTSSISNILKDRHHVNIQYTVRVQFKETGFIQWT